LKLSNAKLVYHHYLLGCISCLEIKARFNLTVASTSSKIKRQFHENCQLTEPKLYLRLIKRRLTGPSSFFFRISSSFLEMANSSKKKGNFLEDNCLFTALRLGFALPKQLRLFYCQSSRLVKKLSPIKSHSSSKLN